VGVSAGQQETGESRRERRYQSSRVYAGQQANARGPGLQVRCDCHQVDRHD